VGCPRIKYIVIFKLKNKFPIKSICKILGVSRSGYYKWSKNLTTKRTKKEQVVAEMIKSYQEITHSTYGYRRMTIWLNSVKDIKINHKTVLRIMKKYGLCSKIRRNRKIKSICEAVHTYENMLKRKFSTNIKNQKWTTDITQFKGSNGILYLSALKDLYDGAILGYAYASNSKTPLVLNTIKQASRYLTDSKNNITILHSDQGAQYTSNEYHEYIESLGIIASMSRPGTPIDNAPIESFFSTMKAEWFPDTSNMTIESIAKDIDIYISFYNNERISLRNKMAPLKYRYIAA